MVQNKISDKFGWYLSIISGSIFSSQNIAITDLSSFYRYRLQPGQFIKIKNIDKKDAEDKFILLPFLESYTKSKEFLQSILNLFSNSHYGSRIDSEYIKSLNSLISHFENQKEKHDKIMFLDLILDTEKENSNRKDIRLGVPEYWLEDNEIDLGDIVLLRNDCPSPRIF